ncbi:hypothetical protein [Luteococcus sp.]|uniref:hypothetical protein n=1 Tax=Luteococcus sp. TaxID=1969402 RepID=UPI003736A457
MPKGQDGEDASEMAAMREIVGIIKQMNIRTTSAHKPLRNLSGGDRQKVALTRWINDGPDVLILNHPTRGLDVRSRQDLYQMIYNHTEQGGSAILISSDPTELRGWCDRIVIMRNGMVCQVVRPDEITDDELDDAMVASPARGVVVDDDRSADGFDGFRASRFLVG